MIGYMNIMQSGKFLPKHPHKIQGRKVQSEFDFVKILGKESIECIHESSVRFVMMQTYEYRYKNRNVFYWIMMEVVTLPDEV